MLECARSNTSGLIPIMAKKLPRFTTKDGRFYWTPSTNGKTRWIRLPIERSQALDKYYQLEAGNTSSTVNEAFDLYLMDPKFLDKLAPITQSDYRRYIKIMRPVFGHLPLDDVDAVMLSQYIDKVGYMGNNHMSPLSKAFQVAILKGLTRHNPCTKGDIVRQPMPARVKEVLLDEIMAVRNASDDHDVQLYVDIALATGLRFSDVTQLGQSNIREDGLVVAVQKRKKAGQVHIYSWTPELRAIVARLPFEYVTNGHKPAVIGVKWLKTRKQLGITDLRLHDIRRFFIQEARRRGHNAQDMAGHSNAAQTARYLAGAPKGVAPLEYSNGVGSQQEIARRVAEQEAELAGYRGMLGVEGDPGCLGYAGRSPGVHRFGSDPH
jgi:integrase